MFELPIYIVFEILSMKNSGKRTIINEINDWQRLKEIETSKFEGFHIKICVEN